MPLPVASAARPASAASTVPPAAARLPSPLLPEGPVVQACLRALDGALDWRAVQAQAGPWVQGVRDRPAPFWALESLLREYPISSGEGLALMRLAEALLRVPDAQTAIALTADQLGRADFEAAAPGEAAGGPHRLLAGLSASAIGLSKRFLPAGDDPPGLLKRLGAQTVVGATVRAIQLLGRQFVLGQSIAEAIEEARAQRRDQPQRRFSFDMLGEGARSDEDAQRYLESYRAAIAAIAAAAGAPGGQGPERRDGISIKLSALFARYEASQRDRVHAELLPRLLQLVDAAARADLNLTVDAEETERLELSLELVEAAAAHIRAEHPGWRGFGLAIQAYQTRAEACVHEVARIARVHGLRFMVRLVKGAYWDGEIKRAQELGLPTYPVFTHKHHTDISYLTCAKALLDHADALYPQFATHNAGTVAALLQMARARGAAFELQRLHGMGEGVYRELLRTHEVPLRVYAPVGEHRDLLAYLVRRLLENGANSSFVHQLADPSVGLDALLASPLAAADGSGQPLPPALYGPGRRNALGVDLSIDAERERLLAAVARTEVPTVGEAPAGAIEATMRRLHAGQRLWDERPAAERAAILELAADRLEAELPAWCGLLVKEARKTLGDCVAEVREAIDFCRYYAQQAREQLAPRTLPGPTGESNTLHVHGRGVFVCISPWNFPLAIFAGQVVAALAAGNAVAAKPAEQTPAVAERFVALLHESGVPRDALALLHGAGETVGAGLVAHPLAAGVCFTGSTQVAKAIQRSLALKDGPLGPDGPPAPIVPLIAETGGLNAMVVDSSALPEQVIDAVVQSAFRSAGQRCSALRLLCVHESVADGVLRMLAGAMRELRVGDAADWATDVGPVIDAEAHAGLLRHLERLGREARRLAESPAPPSGVDGCFVAPVAFDIGRVGELRQEVFGPVLHVLRWGPGTAAPDVDALVEQVNALGYGLTLGVQTRIDTRAQRIAERARVGNVYVNRNMIGAVVGVQPFGGEGLSGTGPKAGGPLYLWRFCSERTVTVNTAAAGGNAELLSGAAAGGGV